MIAIDTSAVTYVWVSFKAVFENVFFFVLMVISNAFHHLCDTKAAKNIVLFRRLSTVKRDVKKQSNFVNDASVEKISNREKVNCLSPG